MPQLKASSLDVILPLVVNKLLQDHVFDDPNLCYLSDDDEEPYYPPAENYAVVVAGDARMWEQSEVGGGRQVTIIDQDVIVAVWARYGVDVAGNATELLTNQARGLLALVHKVLDALSEYFPLDAAGNVYSVEGMRLVRQDRAKRKRGNEEWIRRRSYFRLIYQLDLPYLRPPV